MAYEFEVVAENLLFPEGPIAMADGSVIFCDILAGQLIRGWGHGKTEVVATTGGGPNGAAIGPDGAIYVCNNGGFEWSMAPGARPQFTGCAGSDYAGGTIDRVDPATGKVERLYDRVDGMPLSGPNDIVFDAAGGLWFTDIGKHFSRRRDISGIYYAKADGSEIREIIYGGVSFNGIGLSPDEKTLYASDTYLGRLFAYDLDGPGQLAAAPRRVLVAMPGEATFDSLAVLANGSICVGTCVEGGITTVSPDGAIEREAIAEDIFITNIAFGGADRRTAFLTWSQTGQVVKTRWKQPGLALNFTDYG